MLWTHSHIVFENSAQVMHFRICCATILVIFCPLKRFCNAYRHITYYTQSIVCQRGFSNKFLSSSSWAYAGFAKGRANYFFGGGEGLATRRVAKRLLEGSGACFPKIFLGEWCNLVRFGAYFHKLFILTKSLKISFFLQK